jgi:acetoin:2,6-dichlorophenolindophenol oxidoreductase subunit alpha
LNLNKEKLLEMLKHMITTRYFELSVDRLYREGKIPGGCHLGYGEESTGIGVIAALEKTDYVFSNHRGHGHCIAKGLDLNRMMAELWGKSTGYCRGRGGSMHIMDVKNRLMGTTGIVGGGMPQANGPALKSLIKGTKEVSVVFFGDGASNQGTFHEALNLASIWKLPTIFVLVNNHYAEATPVEYVCNIKNLADRAKSYGIPGVSVDGMDVLMVYDAATEAVQRARKGEGPTLLVLDTYRYAGHYVGEPEGYRTDEEIEIYKKKDCILNFKKYLIENKFLNEEEYKAIDESAKKDLEKAIEFADKSPLPDISDIDTDVYV